MKKLLTIALVCAATGAFAQKTNFSGNYKVNEEKVNWGPAPRFILPRFIKVEQLNDKFIISRTPLNQQLQEQAAVVDTIAFDGTVFNKFNSRGGKTENTIKWTNDSSFVLNKKSFNAQGQATGSVVETWSVEDEGKSLFVNRDVEQGTMKFTTKAYFDKQP